MQDQEIQCSGSILKSLLVYFLVVPIIQVFNLITNFNIKVFLEKVILMTECGLLKLIFLIEETLVKYFKPQRL
jgi:hypothetical protein